MVFRNCTVVMVGIVIGAPVHWILCGKAPVTIALQAETAGAADAKQVRHSPHAMAERGDGHVSPGAESPAVGPVARDGDQPQQEIGAAERLKQFQAVMDRYYRGDDMEKAKRGLEQAVEQYNRWIESANQQHESERAELEKDITSLRAMGSQIEEMDERLAKKPNRSDAAAVKAYNDLATGRNRMVEEYNQRAHVLERRQKALNEAVARSKQEAEVRRKELDARQANIQTEIHQRNRWIEGGEGISFFKDLNRFYAQLSAESAGGKQPEGTARIEEVRAIRREMAQKAIESQQTADGLLIVEATLCGREKCFLIVDTGARVVTIPAALVDALELRDRLGDKAELTLAGGIKASGRELAIPQLSVLGQEAKDVRAVMLDEPGVGVDGLLGMSFLHKFKIRIDQGHPSKLVLEPRSEK